MNQEALKKIMSFCTIDAFPELPCPYCGQETLRLTKRDFHYRELQSQFSEKDFEDIDFECSLLLKAFLLAGEIIRGTMEAQAKFSAFLKCGSCKEVVVAVGKAIVPSKWATEHGCYVQTRILPEFFTPPLPMIPLHPNYPEDLRSEIIRSFSTFFSDAASCGNAIRHSVEELLDDQKIERARTMDDGKRVPLNLHQRIKLFERSFQHAKLLHGIRVIGNEASHNCRVSQDDLLRAYEVLEYVLRALYVQPRHHANMVAKSNLLEVKYKRADAGARRKSTQNNR